MTKHTTASANAAQVNCRIFPIDRAAYCSTIRRDIGQAIYWFERLSEFLGGANEGLCPHCLQQARLHATEVVSNLKKREDYLLCFDERVTKLVKPTTTIDDGGGAC